MDKLKYVKLENPDGSYSDSIPLSVNSDYVDVNGSTLTNELNKKASSVYVNNEVETLQNEINGLASGSPKGSYETTSALISANPATGVYVIQSDGHVYSWTKNGSTPIDLGVYQAVENSDKVQQLDVLTGELKDIMYYKEISVTYEDNKRIGITYGNLTDKTGYKASNYIPVQTGKTYILKGHIYSLCYYNSNQVSKYATIPVQTDLENPVITIPSSQDPVRYMRYSFNTALEENTNVKLYNKDIAEAKVANYEFLPNAISGTAVTVDTTLAVEGMPADSAAVGNAISDIQETFLKDCLLERVRSGTARIFKRVFCVGDSYTSGYIKLPGQDSQKTNLEFAWPHYMSLITGNEWINGGCSGSNVHNWWTNRGYVARQQGNVQAYVIGLMINDVAQVELGTVNDIGTEADTYYGGMSRIINGLLEISPQAKIFLNSCPKEGADFRSYSEALVNITNYYQNQNIPVHYIDLYAYKDLYNQASFSGDYLSSHYTAIGYEQMAEIYMYILSDYINKHISDFQDVAFLPYAEN